MMCFLVFGVVSILFGLFFLILAIRSRNPGNLILTSGELTQQKGFRNYKMKNCAVPIMTEYTYTYTVCGKQYRLRGKQRVHPRNVRKRISIVYLRGFPRCAYEGRFSGIAEWLIAISLIALGALCFVVFYGYLSLL